MAMKKWRKSDLLDGELRKGNSKAQYLDWDKNKLAKGGLTGKGRKRMAVA